MRLTDRIYLFTEDQYVKTLRGGSIGDCFFVMCKTNTESQEKLGNRGLCSKQGDVSPESDLERWI